MNKYNVWDAHAHLQEPWFSEIEINEIIDRAVKSSVEGIINVVSTPVDTAYNAGIDLADKYKLIHLNFGLQPTEASDQTFHIFKNTVETNFKSICAIGEVGLDYYWVRDKKQQRIQNEIFLRIIAFANEVQLPLVIHSRKAEDDCLDLLERHAEVPVLMHGIEATLEHIKRIIDLDYVLTIPTSVCNRKKYKKIAIRTPLEHILLETDSPFQLPFNLEKNEQKEKNEPSNIIKSVERIAEIKQVKVSEVANVTRANTLSFFKV
jgi:TatD DNase family protein